MRSKQKLEQTTLNDSGASLQAVSKQQDFFTNSTVLSLVNTKSETLGQIPTDKECISCSVPLTEDNWYTSFVEKKHYKCKTCYDIRRVENRIKNGERTPMLLAKLFGWKTQEVYNQVAEGAVYVMTNPSWEGWVKVGMAVDAEDRLKSYQTSSPYRDYELKYIIKTVDRRKSEAEAHTALEQKYERRNEWFLCSPSQAIEVLHEEANRKTL